MKASAVPAIVCLVLALCLHNVSSLTLKDLIGRIQKNKRCSAIPTQKDFSVDKFAGTWYGSFQVNPLLQSNPPCSVFDITVHPNSTLSLRLDQRILTGVVLRGFGDGSTPNSLKEPGVMDWRWNFAPGVNDTMKIIETDYENFAVIITCNLYGDSATAFVFSRHQVIPQDYLKKGKKMLSSYMDMSQGFIMQTANCNLDPVSPNDSILKFGDINIEQIFQTLFSKR